MVAGDNKMVRTARVVDSTPTLLDSPTDTVEIEQSRARRAQYDRNWKWFQTQIVELGKTHFARYVCVAGEQAFFADSAEEAASLARTAHPEDFGRFVYYFPTHRLARVHAHYR